MCWLNYEERNDGRYLINVPLVEWNVETQNQLENINDDVNETLVFDGNKFAIKIRKKAHTPVLKEVEKLQIPFEVPWLSGKTLEIIWTA